MPSGPTLTPYSGELFLIVGANACALYDNQVLIVEDLCSLGPVVTPSDDDYPVKNHDLVMHVPGISVSANGYPCGPQLVILANAADLAFLENNLDLYSSIVGGHQSVGYRV